MVNLVKNRMDGISCDMKMVSNAHVHQLAVFLLIGHYLTHFPWTR